MRYFSKVAFEIAKSDCEKLYEEMKTMEDQELTADLEKILASAKRIEFKNTVVFSMVKVKWNPLSAEENGVPAIKYLYDFIVSVPHKFIRIGEDKEDIVVSQKNGSQSFDNIDLVQKIIINAYDEVERHYQNAYYAEKSQLDRFLNKYPDTEEVAFEMAKCDWERIWDNFELDDFNLEEALDYVMYNCEWITFKNSVVLHFKNVKWQNRLGELIKDDVFLKPHIYIEISNNYTEYSEFLQNEYKCDHLILRREIQIKGE